MLTRQLQPACVQKCRSMSTEISVSAGRHSPMPMVRAVSCPDLAKLEMLQQSNSRDLERRCLYAHAMEAMRSASELEHHWSDSSTEVCDIAKC